MMKFAIMMFMLPAVAAAGLQGAFNGVWTTATSNWAPDVGAVTKLCFSVCGEMSLGSNAVVTWDGDDDDTVSATYQGSDLTFSFDESEDGGVTSNDETWQNAGGAWTGGTTWTWKDTTGDSSAGTNTFESSLTLTCWDGVKLASYEGTWTNTASSSPPEVGVESESNFEITKEYNKYYVRFDEDVEKIEATWEECKKTLTFSYDEAGDGGTTTNNEVWTVASDSSITGKSTWTFKESGKADITGASKMECSKGGSSASGGVSVGLVIGCVIGGIYVFTICLWLYTRSRFRSAEDYNDSNFGADQGNFQNKQSQLNEPVVVAAVAMPVQPQMATAVAY